MHFWVAFAQFLYFTAGVHNGRMVAASEVSPDFLQAVLCELSGEVHTNLSRFGDTLAAFLTLESAKRILKCRDTVSMISLILICFLPRSIWPSRAICAISRVIGSPVADTAYIVVSAPSISRILRAPCVRCTRPRPRYVKPAKLRFFCTIAIRVS